MSAPLDRITSDLRAALQRLGEALREPMAEEVFARLAGYLALMDAATMKL